jgi:ribosomal protein S18 acetylase RimI-like enzyme
MSTTLIEIRRARPSDARAVAAAHDEAWRTAYQGIIPGLELERLINRRGAAWWDGSIRKGSRVSLFVFGDAVAGYANYGRNRARSLNYEGEIYELYLRPQYQGLGFGRRLFSAARRDLLQRTRRPILSGTRRSGGGALVRSLRRQGARQGGLRLERVRLRSPTFLINHPADDFPLTAAYRVRT